MDFSKKFLNGEVIYNINSEIIDEKIMNNIIKTIKPNIKTGLNMKNVKSITSVNFIKYLLEDRFKLFNIQSELLAYISLVLKDNFLKSFMNYEDFSSNKRELIKRKFIII